MSNHVRATSNCNERSTLAVQLAPQFANQTTKHNGSARCSIFQCRRWIKEGRGSPRCDLHPQVAAVDTGARNVYLLPQHYLVQES
jgi:hypothetical protein